VLAIGRKVGRRDNISVGEVEKLEPLYTVGGIIKA
jgi:hypothetical protein